VPSEIHCGTSSLDGTYARSLPCHTWRTASFSVAADHLPYHLAPAGGAFSDPTSATNIRPLVPPLLARRFWLGSTTGPTSRNRGTRLRLCRRPATSSARPSRSLRSLLSRRRTFSLRLLQHHVLSFSPTVAKRIENRRRQRLRNEHNRPQTTLQSRVESRPVVPATTK